ncbi:hypothetical protein D1007_19070 [Hordeum vulgare]|nr:hypothetical protein D1007_19070 [Hordeum vulgare]
MAVAEGHQALVPALGRFIALNCEGLDKALFMVVADSSECGPTKILQISIPLAELTTTSVALLPPALVSRLLPPFSEFFNVLLTHFHIDAMYLDQRTVPLLSSFAFLYEAFLGVPLRWHFSDTSSPSD